MSCYKVFIVTSTGMPRAHHSLFVETNDPSPSAGHIFQVTGNIQSGMVFEDKTYANPPEEENPSFISKVAIGTVAENHYPHKFREICLSVGAPKKQFDGPKRLFPHEPLRRCQEWTADAIRALRESGVLTL